MGNKQKHHGALPVVFSDPKEKNLALSVGQNFRRRKNMRLPLLSL
jgi:hypothetical protein